MFKKRVLAVLLSVVMTATMLVALPTAAHAAGTDPVEIDVTLNTGDIGDGATAGFGNVGHATESEWGYYYLTKILRLWTEDGDYTLTGINGDLTIAVMTNAKNAKVKLNGLNITADTNNYEGLGIGNSCTITLVGSNSVTGATGCQGLNVSSYSPNTCTITGGGTLVATGGSGNTGIYISANDTLVIDGNASVTAVGGATGNAINNLGTIQIGDNAKLTMTNNSGSDETHTFTKADTAETHIWKLTGGATLVIGSLDDDTIEVSIAAGATGTVEREAHYVCAIGTTRYTTLALALAAVPTGGTTQTTIKLLTNITVTANTTIGNKKITFDLNGKNLLFTGYLMINGGSVVNYTGAGVFKVARSVSLGNNAHEPALVVSGINTEVTLTGVEIIDSGSGTNASVSAIEFGSGGTVTVNGNVKATCNTTGTGMADGIFFSGSGTVTVYGDVISNDSGVWADNSLKVVEVTVSGAIKAVGEGVHVGTSSTVTINGNIEADGDGVVAKAGTATNPTKVTINGNIDAGRYGVDAEANTTVTVTGDIDAYIDGVHARGGAKVTVTGDITAQMDDGVDAHGTGTEVTVNGTIEAVYGIYAGQGAKVTVNSDITAETEGVLAHYDGTEITVNGNIVSENDGVDASGGAKVTVNGNITADGLGVYAESATVTVNGNIEAGDAGVAAFDDGTEVVINGSIVSGDTGVYADTETGNLSVTVNGSITAGHVGVAAVGEVVVFVGGNIDVTGPDDPAFPVCGVFVAEGAKVTVEGTITAPNYIAFYNPAEDDFYYLTAAQNTSPSGLPNYLQYDDEGAYDMLGSYVWVKDPRTLTPGTGDGTTLWLLFGALLVAALGTGLVLAYRRREQEV